MASKVAQELQFLLAKHQLGDLAKAEVAALENGFKNLIAEIKQTFESFEPAQPAPVDPTPQPEPAVDPQPEQPGTDAPVVDPTTVPAEEVTPSGADTSEAEKENTQA